MSIKLSALTTEQAVKEWTVLSGFLAKVIDLTMGRVTLDDTLEFIKTGKMMVLIAWDPDESQIYAVFTAEANQYPGRRVFCLSMCGGTEIERWGHLYPAFKQIARDLGFNQIEASGRAGWKKFLPGATEVGRTFIEDLEVKENE